MIPSEQPNEQRQPFQESTSIMERGDKLQILKEGRTGGSPLSAVCHQYEIQPPRFYSLTWKKEDS